MLLEPDTCVVSEWAYVLPEAGEEPEVVLPGMELFDKASFFAESPYLLMGAGRPERGFTSPAVPYSLHSDDVVTGILLVCCVAMACVFATCRRLTRRRAKRFFRRPVERGKLVPERTGAERRGDTFLHLQWGVLVAILFFCYTQATRDVFMPQLAPHAMLGLYAVAGCTLMAAKGAAYRFVNWIFFDKIKRAEWQDAYNFLMSAESALLLPLVLITVYSNPEAQKMTVIFIFLMIIIRILLCYKTFCIFFPKIHCALHLIAYLCALEIIPLCALFTFLTMLNELLL